MNIRVLRRKQMNYNTKKLENKNIELRLELNANEWESLVEDAYNKNKGKYKVEGFRSGKAPRKMIEKMYGPHIFFEDAITEGFNKHYIDILEKDKSIDPIDSPELKVEKLDDTGITIVAEIPVRPEVKLGSYKGLKINIQPKEISDNVTIQRQGDIIDSDRGITGYALAFSSSEGDYVIVISLTPDNSTGSITVFSNVNGKLSTLASIPVTFEQSNY